MQTHVDASPETPVDSPVKNCPKCQAAFSLADLLESPAVDPIGMLVVPGAPELSSYYFNHICPDCGTTFLVPLEAFRSEIREPLPEEDLFASDKCERHCARLDDLQVCDQPCHNAPYRRFLLSVLIRPSRRPGQANHS